MKFLTIVFAMIFGASALFIGLFYHSEKPTNINPTQIIEYGQALPNALNDLRQVQTQLTALQADYNALADQLAIMIDPVAHATVVAQLTALQADYNALADQLAIMIDPVAHATVVAQLTTLQADYNALADQLTTLQADYNTLAEQLAIMIDPVAHATVVAQLTALQADYNALADQLTTLQADYNTLAEQLEIMQQNNPYYDYVAINAIFGVLSGNTEPNFLLDPVIQELYYLENINYIFDITDPTQITRTINAPQFNVFFSETLNWQAGDTWGIAELFYTGGEKYLPYHDGIVISNNFSVGDIGADDYLEQYYTINNEYPEIFEFLSQVWFKNSTYAQFNVVVTILQ